MFGEWFAGPGFDGCSFLTTMIETPDTTSPVYQAAVEHLANIRVFLTELAAAAGIEDTDRFARAWHILMKGSIMAAHEGDKDAAGRAREVGELLLASYGVSG